MNLEDAKSHGLSETEFEAMKKCLGRVPNRTELGVFSVMWSEHCSYKTSRLHLAKLPTEGPAVLIGPGENAGAVDIGNGYAAVFKMESHNHPSFIEPFQGAATGVGGILRDVFTMGARPIANLNSLRFGEAHHPKTKHLINGVVGGIAHYGNCMGVPTVGGEVYFDESYNGNILVNAFTIGVCKSADIFKGVAEGVGNPVYYVGSGTGRDGIHGATMASESFEEGDEEKRPTVQVGDPFREKLLLEACLELMATGAIIGIQDMGAAGLTSSAVEMADRAGNGLSIDIDKVPKREEGMSAYEVLLSESQERMLMVVDPDQVSDVGRIFDKWELEWAEIGKVTDTGRLEVFQHGEQCCSIPIDALTSAAPRYDRPTRPLVHEAQSEEIIPPDDLSKFLISFIGTPNLCSRSQVFSQYDFMVGTNTIMPPGRADSAIVRTPEGALDLALSVDCPSRKVFLNPREGSKHVVAECTRNLACVGALPVGATDCLNFGDPTKPEIMWQFVESIEGMAEACRLLKTPIVGGNVSLYNASGDVDIYPTPGFAAVGTLEKVNAISMKVQNNGDSVFVLGKETLVGDLGASEYLWQSSASLGSRLPEIDLALELALQELLRELIHGEEISSAHDCSEGGLGIALLEILMGTALGINLELEVPPRPDNYLFSETPSRVLVSCSGKQGDALVKKCGLRGVGCHLIGKVQTAKKLEWKGVLSVDLEEAERSWKKGLDTLI